MRARRKPSPGTEEDVRGGACGAEQGRMSARSGAAPRGGSCNPSLQPLRATVPYQLQRGSALLCREGNAGEEEEGGRIGGGGGGGVKHVHRLKSLVKLSFPLVQSV